MKKTLWLFIFVSLCFGATAQYRPRPDAFPPVDEPAPKALNMATTVEQMASWNRYPTYETYLAMMQRWTEEFPTLCHVDTIGRSVQGRLILSMYIEPQTDDDLYRPEFFYSSTIHGDELTGYVMMLRLIDTLLRGYGDNPQYTDLINRTRISINPLANPDGTYYGGNNTVQGSRRYNYNNKDLNRNFPDPFYPTKDTVEQENEVMIAYVRAHQFKLSANLHGGAEVINYPWDSFTSAANPHPDADWWKAVGRRFVDTTRLYSTNHFNDVWEANNGVVAGGDWYVITGGRQDYMNQEMHCHELTMEVSHQKKLSSDQLPEYWRFMQHSLVNYIAEIHTMPGGSGVGDVQSSVEGLKAWPNPVVDRITLDGLPEGAAVEVCDMQGRRRLSLVAHQPSMRLDLSELPSGMYVVGADGRKKIIVKL